MCMGIWFNSSYLTNLLGEGMGGVEIFLVVTMRIGLPMGIGFHTIILVPFVTTLLKNDCNMK